MQRQGPDGRLAEFFADVVNEQSSLAKMDCVIFVVDALRYGFDVDLRDRLRYHDKKTALARIRKHRGLDGAIQHELGPPLPRDQLRYGDVAFIRPHAIGLVMPTYIAVKGRSTIWRITLDLAVHGWRVT
jgi:hypothetical protein